MKPASFRLDRILSLGLSAGALFAIAGCNTQKAPQTSCSEPACCTDPLPSKSTAATTQPDQRAFKTPQEAASALKEAGVTGDRGELLSIFGSGGEQLIFTGDPVEEQNALKQFAGHLSEYTRIDQENPNKAVLYIGLKNWPFPIPIVKSDKGWTFDTAAGKEEILNRRVGRNELNAISVCRAYVIAQKAYASKPRNGDPVVQYAQHFRSSEGKQDGLYWAAGENEEISPMGPLVAEAQAEGYLQNPPDGQRHPYHGYFFQILKSQGEAATGGKLDYVVDGKLTKGFAMVAWPDSWGDSGVMTFIVNQDGKVYQKNLGEKTADAVKEITAFNPDKGWEEVKD